MRLHHRVFYILIVAACSFISGQTLRAADPDASEQFSKLLDEAWDYRSKLLDTITLADESLSDAALAEADERTVRVPAEKIRAIVRELTLKREVQPVLCGSGREHVPTSRMSFRAFAG